jgi:hypothetical protein
MSQKITCVNGAGVSVSMTFTNSKYSTLRSEWTLDESPLRAVFSGKYNRKERGWYLLLTIAYNTIKNSDLQSLYSLFSVATTGILYYPDSNSIECFAMDIPASVSYEDFLETYQHDFDIVLRSVNRYENPFPLDITYIGTRKIDITNRHIQINGVQV